MKLKSVSAIALAIVMLPSLVMAQGMMAKLKSAMAAHKAGAMSSMSTMGKHKGHKMGGMMGMMHTGKIVGDKKTHVYHLPGSGGMMPSAANSVYFDSAGAAEAAGYHVAGSKGGAKSSMMSGKMGGHKMSGGMMGGKMKMGKMKGMKHMKHAKSSM